VCVCVCACSAEGGPLKLAKNKCVVVGKDSKLQIGACNSAGALGWRFVGGKLTQGANATIAKEVCTEGSAGRFFVAHVCVHAMCV
jgi:hypothetical protein